MHGFGRYGRGVDLRCRCEISSRMIETDISGVQVLTATGGATTSALNPLKTLGLCRCGWNMPLKCFLIWRFAEYSLVDNFLRLDRPGIAQS